MSYKKVFYSVLTIFSVSLLAKALGFFRETFLASYFGTSHEIDLYYLVYGIFFALASIIGTSIGVAYIPEHFRNKNSENWKLKSYEMFLFTCLVSFVLMFVSFVCAGSLANLLNADQTIESFEKIVLYIKINSVGFFFQTLTFFLVAILNAEKKFGRGELIGTAYSITVILALLFFYRRFEINAIIYCFLFSSTLTFSILYYYIYRLNFYFPKFSFKYYIIITSATLIGTSTIYIGQIYDRLIASRLVEGSLSALSYSGNVHSLVNVFFIVSVVNVVYSELNSYSKTNENFKKQIQELINFAFRLFAIVLLPLSLFMYLYANKIVSVIFERGNFNEYSVILTGEVFKMYVLGSFFFALRDLGNKLFYTFENRRTPIFLGITFLLVNFVLCYILANSIGVKGISLAVTLTSFFYMVYVFFLLKKKYAIVINKQSFLDFFKIIGFCFLVFLVFDEFSNYLEFGNLKKEKIFSLIISSGLFLMLYVLYCYIVNVTLVKQGILKFVKKRKA